jgi:hypothetical protein
MAHTPGPWRYETNVPAAYVEQPEEKLDIITDSEGYVLADVYIRHEDGWLIATAPDLLAACKRLLEEIHEQGYDYYNTPILGAIEQAQEAIAKAEPPLVCHHCQSVIHPGDKEFEDEDGPLCWECYGELHGARDAADAWWRRGDIEYDRSRGN